MKRRGYNPKVMLNVITDEPKQLRDVLALILVNKLAAKRVNRYTR